MANVIKKSTNRWTKGLVMDFSPENTSNEVLTHALNATLLTFNGNELSLQSDMGNARVETAYLPEGYIPVGTCEYGGIIYIVSYNPLEDKSQIGCFPSPERNISSDELGIGNETIVQEDFIKDGNIINNTKHILLKNDPLNPGDKFIVTANEEIYKENLADLYTFDGKNFNVNENPIMALNLVSISDSGKITYLNNEVVKYDQTTDDTKYKYHILGSQFDSNGISTPDIDSYRNVVSSGYSVFKQKTSGKLAILSELIMVDSYSVTHKILTDPTDQNLYNLVLHIETSSENAKQKYGVIPQLSYYYLEKSQGYIPYSGNSVVASEILVEQGERRLRTLFDKNQNTKVFTDTELKDVYDVNTLLDIYKDKTFTSAGFEFNFPSPNTYHSEDQSYLPNTITNDNIRTYNELKLASIKIPQGIVPMFTYDYTITPCMSYGKLNHLSVSNTINFQNLFDFDKSKFNMWKYRVDGNQVRLTFGTEIYDTNVQNGEVVGIVLEFYDHLGFAGSLIIKDRQSYSGTFTKLLQLNSTNTLSKRKLKKYNSDKWEFIETYHRNISTIINKTNEDGTLSNSGTLNGKIVKWKDSDTGWEYAESQNIEFPNDCGALYPNIVYGVKPYLLQKSDSDDKYIVTDKGQFFLFTSSILNDYYYTKDNFNELGRPKLDFVLTYKVTDESDVIDVTSTENGGQENLELINKYTQGNFDGNELEGTKYLQYNGTSKLQLEIGLKQDYENLGFSYDPNINNQFKCTLELSNDAGDGQLDIKSNSSNYTNPSDILGYDINQTNQNIIQFNSNTAPTINVDNLSQYGFMNIKGNSYIDIIYNFIVAHHISISDIRETKVPATTVCALCHKKDDGTYNYEDFGIYEKTDNDGKSYYFSNTVFYNAGTNKDVEFGLCKQLSQAGTILEQCQSYINSNYESYRITKPRLFNTKNPLQNLVGSIGKLAFLEPYVGGLSEETGVNVCYASVTGNSHHISAGSLWITPDLGGGSDANGTWGFAPSRKLYQHPSYIACLNTKDMLNYVSEFIVTMQNNTAEIPAEGTPFIIGRSESDPYDDNVVGVSGYNKPIQAREFIGLTGPELASFNKTLLTTMKDIYAYNPDYDSLLVRQGNVNIKNTQSQFTSNLLSKYASLGDIDSINDYIQFSYIKVSDYLNYMNKYSDNIIQVKENNENEPNTWLPQINFKPDLTYCGGEGTSALLTTLTYNIPEPINLYNELSFSQDTDSIIVRKEDGSISRVKGNLNKNALYGYNDNNSLVQLDVANYNIEQNGHLVLLKTPIITHTQKYNAVWQEEVTVVPSDLNTTSSISIESKFRKYSADVTSANQFKTDNNKLIAYISITDVNGEKQLYDNPVFDFNIRGEYGATIEKQNIQLKIWSYFIDNTQMASTNASKYIFNQQDFSDVWTLFTTGSGSLKRGNSYEQVSINSLTTLFSHYVYVDDETIGVGGYSYPSQYTLSSNKLIKINPDLRTDNLTGINWVVLVEISDIEIKSTHLLDYDNSEKSIINFYKSKEYSSFVNNKYEVYNNYKNSVFIGTSITINDLLYEPNQNGHRLYVNPKYVKYSYDEPRAKLYFRTLTPDAGSNRSTTWLGDTDYHNSIHINTGPCFTPEFWNND